MKKILLPVCLSCMAIAGCRSADSAEQPQGYFFLKKSADFTSIGKTVVLELEDQTAGTDLARKLTEELADSLGKKHLFSVQSVFRSQPLWQNLNTEGIRENNLADLAQLRQSLGVDAAMFGTITGYRTYPRLMLGLRIKMVDIRDGQLLWAIEEVWDSTDKTTEERMKNFFEKNMRTGYEPMNWQLLIASPGAFNKFVMAEVTGTLPKSRVK